MGLFKYYLILHKINIYKDEMPITDNEIIDVLRKAIFLILKINKFNTNEIHSHSNFFSIINSL